MTISLRLKNDLALKLQRRARQRRVSQSSLIRELLQTALHDRDDNSAWSTGQKYFGKYASGRSDLSVNYKSQLKDKLRGKHRSH